MKKFSDFNLDKRIHNGINVANFVFCTPVQEKTFEAVFNGHDVTVQSQTGTGKTAAFLLSIFQLLLNKGNSPGGRSKEQVLILAPTRELVVQIEEEAELLGKFLDFAFCAVYGGVGYQKQEQQLARQPEFIIGTPGRLLDFVQNRKIDLQSFGYLVIDEADRMFDMGFYPDIQRILKGMRHRNERRTLLFSATLSTKVLNIAWNFMNSPTNIEIEPEHVTVESITQELYHVSKKEKIPLLLGLVKKYQPESAIFFTNTKRMAEELSFRLRANNFTSEFIMGDLPQRKRLNIIQAVKQKEIRFLVATDVAARGLHIDDLKMVFNYDLPEDPENYVHRIGRTARAGNVGMAVSLVDEYNVYNLAAIEQFVGIKIPAIAISSKLLEEDISHKSRFQSEYRKRERSGVISSKQHSDRSKPSRSSNRQVSNNHRGGRSNHSDNRSDNRRSSQVGRSRQQSTVRGKREDQATKRVLHSVPAHANNSQLSERDLRSTRLNRVTMGTQERLEYYARKYGDSFSAEGMKSKKIPTTKNGVITKRGETNGIKRNTGRNTKRKRGENSSVRGNAISRNTSNLPSGTSNSHVSGLDKSRLQNSPKKGIVAFLKKVFTREEPTNSLDG